MSKMTKYKARERRAERRAKAQLWAQTVYPAVIIGARLSGVHGVIRWHEYERRPLQERWAKRRLLQLWAQYYEAFPKNHWWENPPTDWLAFKWEGYLAENLRKAGHEPRWLK